MPAADPGPGSRQPIKGLLPSELEHLALSRGAPRHAARQLLNWLYRRDAASFSSMTDLRRSFRDRLLRDHRVNEAEVETSRRAKDGTEKLVVRMTDGARVETVVIPEPERVTVCVSTQVGCARGCTFCATARMKLVRQLSAGEILDQVLLARRRARVSNVVFMGMGEPLDNYEAVKRAALLLTDRSAFGIGQRHVTISTVGVVPRIRQLAAEGVPGRLTVSLTAPDDELRSRLVPANRRWPLRELMDACRDYARATRRQVTFAYVMLNGVNDTDDHADRLAALALKARAKVNLIPFNDTGRFSPPPPRVVESFHARVRRRNVRVFVRREHGEEIAAACGQLVLEPVPA